MENDLGINVSDRAGIGESLGQGEKRNFIHFNAIGLLYVNPENGETEIIRKKFLSDDKKPMVLWKGKKAKLEYEIELK